MRIVPATLIGAFLLSLSPTLALSAEGDLGKLLQDRLAARIAKLESACGSDIKKYCREVTPGEGRVLYCLQAYEDKISSKCIYGLEDTLSSAQTLFDALREAVVACRADIATACGKVQPGQGRIAACILQNRATVSKECGDSVDRLQAASAEPPAGDRKDK